MKILRKQKCKMKFIDSNRDIPVVELKFRDEVSGYAVVDTGSEYTVFESDFVTKNREIFSLEYTEEYMQVINVSSEKVIPIINASASISVDDQELNLSGIKNDMHLSVTVNGEKRPIITVIGNDFLTEYRANIDYKKKIVSFQE